MIFPGVIYCIKINDKHLHTLYNTSLWDNTGLFWDNLGRIGTISISGNFDLQNDHYKHILQKKTCCNAAK